MKSEWIDISVSLRTGMVHWPNDPPVCIEQVSDMSCGDKANLSKMDMSVHSGTHVDAPLHFIRDGKSVDAVPFDALIGKTRVIEIAERESISVKALAANRILRGERILFKTRNSEQKWAEKEFMPHFVYLSTEAAGYLAELGVKTVGVDYLSVSGYGRNEVEVHQKLLEADIWVIEGLYLGGVNPGNYHMICLPLNIYNGEGAPARAILKPIPETGKEPC